jgi:hypothetical protein
LPTGFFGFLGQDSQNLHQQCHWEGTLRKMKLYSRCPYSFGFGSCLGSVCFGFRKSISFSPLKRKSTNALLEKILWFGW